MKTGNLDGQGLAQLQNYKFQMLSSAPTPAEAKFYYDTSLHSFRYYNGTEWVDGAKFAAGLGIDATAFTNGTIKVDFTEVATAAQGGLADSAIQPNDNVSELNNDAGYITSSDVGNGALTIQRNGTGVGTFTANQTSATTVNITVPTSASDVGAVPTSRTINGKALTSNITITAADTGALPDSTTIGSANLTIKRNNVGIGTFSANATSATTVNISVPTTATEVGALPSTTTINDLTTTAQQNALNSGATTTNIGQIATNTSAISGLSTSKQDKLTAGSNIQINGTTISATDTIYTLPTATTSTLGGVKVGTNLSIDANGVLSADAQSITVDTTLSTTSTNPVQNKVVTSAIQSKTSVTFVDWTV